MTKEEIATIATAYEMAWLRRSSKGGVQTSLLQPRSSAADISSNKTSASALKTLSDMGCTVYNKSAEDRKLDWNCLAGYDHVKREVEDTVLLSLKHPEEYNKIAEQTRGDFESNRPKAILFDGPPGTGKTTTARIIASQVEVPLIYVPIESLVSKWVRGCREILGQSI